MSKHFEMHPSPEMQHWIDKLTGKKIVEEPSDDPNTFYKRDLPGFGDSKEICRILPPGSKTTRDFRPDRLNVHVDENGVCTHISFM